MKQEMLHYKQHVVYTPDMIPQLPQETLMTMALQASSLIDQLGGKNMFHYPPETLFAFLTHGLALFSTDESGTLSGFIKVDPWVEYPHGKPADDGVHGTVSMLNHIESAVAVIKGFESGSMVVDPKHQNHGLASHLKDMMAKHTVQQFPGIPVFSVVTNTNAPSLAANHKLGWQPIMPEEAQGLIGIDFIHVEDWDASVPVTVFVYPPSIQKKG